MDEWGSTSAVWIKQYENKGKMPSGFTAAHYSQEFGMGTFEAVAGINNGTGARQGFYVSLRLGEENRMRGAACAFSPIIDEKGICRGIVIAGCGSQEIHGLKDTLEFIISQLHGLSEEQWREDRIDATKIFEEVNSNPDI